MSFLPWLQMPSKKVRSWGFLRGFLYPPGVVFHMALENTLISKLGLYGGTAEGLLAEEPLGQGSFNAQRRSVELLGRAIRVRSSIPCACLVPGGRVLLVASRLTLTDVLQAFGQ